VRPGAEGARSGDVSAEKETGVGPAEPGTLYAIGEAAQRAGVSTRTLRYYQELGLLTPSGRSPGGNRRYSSADVARLLRILELRDVMGFDLERIGTILAAEDRLAELRDEVQRGISTERHRQIVKEAIALNARMQSQVHDKLSQLDGFLDELRSKAGRYREIAHELGIDDPDPDLASSGR
jgi:MerR family transcriptional regulator, repressor of the yfmOP operon